MESWKYLFRSASAASKSFSQSIPRRTSPKPLSSRFKAYHTAFRQNQTKAASLVKQRQFQIGFATTLALAGAFVTSSYGFAEPARKKIHIPKEKLFRLSEVQQHNSDSDRFWVYRGDRVYDITDWIPLHPGGEVILKAAGGSLDPYWDIFTIHKKPEVYEILEEYFIGKIDPRDLINGKPPVTDIQDPFAVDPKRDEALVQHTARPCNAETPAAGLLSYLTPNPLFYVRNHFWVPKIVDADSYKLSVELADGTEVTYTLDDLRKKFKPHTVTVTLQCAGNRRSHMTREAGKTNGLPWNVGAISTAEWTGVKLRDLLADAGLPVDSLPDDAKHAQFMAAEAYGASIPIDKAIDSRGDVLLAYEMNGEPLPPDHGFPLRVVVPGNVAARSVKWLKKIVISDEESWTQWQRKDYKCFGPNEGQKPDWDKAVSIQEMPVQAAITSIKRCRGQNQPQQTQTDVSQDCKVEVQGYAYSGGGRKIVRVDISPDNGKTWQQAEILDANEKGSKSWSWRLWRHSFPADQCQSKILVKATDCSYNTQPESFAPQYNYRGNLGNAWHKVDTSEIRD